MKQGALAGAAAAILCLAAPARAAEPMTLADYMALKGPAPTARIAYGPAQRQYVELFTPAGPGPFPVAVLIHGGCFLNKYEGMPQLRGMAGALNARGVAVMSVEYRGLDAPGGGWPGTFLDVRAAMDLLAAQAKARRLDTRRLVVVGHSAGAALALWTAGRGRIAKASPLYEPHPLAVRHVVALGGTGDLHLVPGGVWDHCGVDVSKLVGSATPARPDPFADTSPIALTPNGSETVLINGDRDTITPPKESAGYAASVRQRGDRAEAILLPNASHYDEVAATSPSWSQVEAAILKAVGIEPQRPR